MSLRFRIAALAVLPLAMAILGVAGFITWQSARLAQSSIATFERNALAAKEEELASLMSLATSAIRAIYDSAAPDDAAAQARVKEILRGLDYGRDGYFFVYDHDGNNLVHPRQSDLPGQNWLGFVDPDGKPVVVRLIEIARAGGGYYQYKWNRPSTGAVADKISLVVDLPKWGWILGTGAYLDQLQAQTAAAQADLRRSIGWTFLVVAATAVPALLLVFGACMTITLQERRLADGKLKALAQRVIDAQEEERARIARELHDGISQTLLSVRYAMDLAGRQSETGAATVAPTIARGVETLNGAIKEVRRLSHGLRPPLLDELGLVAALRALWEGFAERTGIAAQLDADGFEDSLRPEAATALYRVVQEALSNIERHSGASTVRLRLWSEQGRARMQVGDDGRGFDPEAAGGGLGLRNMQERIAHFGGILLVRSDARGTVLTVLMPASANRPGEVLAA